MRNWISLAMALFGVVNIAAGAWGLTYLISKGYAGGGALFLCLLAIAIGIGLLEGATQ